MQTLKDIASVTDHKILLVGSDKIYAIENFYSKYFKEFGATVDQFPASSIFNDYYRKNIFHKIIFKAGISNIFKKINGLFKQAVETVRPDVIWVFKGMELFPSSLVWAKDQKIKLVNYNPDNPFIFSGKGSGNENITRSIALYDLHLTYHLGVKHELEEKHHLLAGLLPFGFDDSESLFEACSKQDEVLKLCFIGNPDSRRSSFIEALAARGISIHVYGNNWNEFLQHKNITIFQQASGIELWKVLRRYRVQLNLMRIHNDDSHNMRSFEVPGIGGIMVAPDTVEHRLYFDHGKEAFLYKDIDSCAEMIKMLLLLSVKDANEIRVAARERSIDSGYSYKERARQALHQIEALLP